MRHLVFCSTCIALALSSFGIANAGFVPDRDAWAALSKEAKLGYVMGVLDAATKKEVWKEFPKADLNDPQFARYVLARAWESCLIDKSLSSNDLVGFVNNSYASGENWDESPWFILNSKVANICIDYVKDERRRVGLK